MHRARLALPHPSQKPRNRLPAWNVGCSGWFYWHWRPAFYPDHLPTKLWFAHHASAFRTVELNAPFYSWPTVNTVKNWVRQATCKGFVYIARVSEPITHRRRFRHTKTLVKDFGFIAELLGERMGCFLFQMPPNYHDIPARLKSILD